MAENSKIEWTDHTFNPWIGCTQVSPGCAHCYAETLMDTRYGRVKWGKGQPRQRTSAANWKLPLRWNRELAEHNAQHGDNQRLRVFCASLADWLDDEVQIEWLADLLALIHATPNLDWLLLTKRPENFRARLIAARGVMFADPLDVADRVDRWLDGNPWRNVWIGTTVEDQTRANERIPHLLDIPARVRFLSCEPLLGPVTLFSEIGDHGAGNAHGAPTETVDVERSKDRTIPPDILSAPFGNGSLNSFGIDWIIAGGESGHAARPMHPAWARSLRDQCAAAGVPFLFKQWGEHAPDPAWDLPGNVAGVATKRVGKKAAGRLLDGVENNGFPRF